jgi:hypothetical protein
MLGSMIWKLCSFSHPITHLFKTNQPTNQPANPAGQSANPASQHLQIINYVVNSAFLNGKQNESQSFKELP